MEDSQLGSGFKLPVAGVELSDSTVLPAIETGLELRPIMTPATKNCMAMALAQAVANHDLVAHDGTLELLTATIKRGICWATMLNFDEQFNHSVRTATLVNVLRGWTDMSPRDSAKNLSGTSTTTPPPHRRVLRGLRGIIGAVVRYY